MIDILWLIVKMILSILPFAFLCIKSSKVNYEKADRSRQFFIPVIAVVFSVITMLCLKWINSGLLKLIYSIPEWITELANLLSAVEPVSGAIDAFANFLDSLIKKINFGYWIFYISNTVLILAYLSVKKLFLKIFQKKSGEESALHSSIAGHFYEYFSEKNKWCIKDDYVQVRSFLKVFYYTAVILSVVLMLVSSKFYFDELIRVVYYPVYGIIFVGELYFYLDGLTKKEYSEHILGEDEDSYKTVNYTLIRKFLRSLFGDKLLVENTSVNNNILNETTTDEIIDNLEKSEDPKVITFAHYYKALNATGFELDQNYITSSLELLEGKSILFNNPFYNDLVPYVFYPMNRMLLRHKKVLIVLGRHSVEEDIVKWIEDGISAVTNLPFLWRINILNENPEQNYKSETDIGIITRSDVTNIGLHNANADFLENVGFVIVLEPSKLISTAQIGLSLIVSRCKGNTDKPVTYCMCDKNCDGLVDAMSHILRTSITEVSATKKHMGTSSYMCWKADADYLHHRIVPNISRYLGLGTELSFVALKNQVSTTKWYGGESFPVLDMHWIDKQYYYDLMRYAGLPINQDVMDERFKTSSNYWSAGISDYNYFVVEDESYNMFEILRNFATRSKEQGFINVISSEYLLKDYMAENESIFETDAKAIPRIVADFVRSNRNVALKLILMMSTYPVNKDILEKELSLIGLEVFSLKKQLWYAIYCCYSGVQTLNNLSDNYKEAVEQASTLTISVEADEVYEVDINVLCEADGFNVDTGRMEHTYEICDKKFLKYCVRELRSAGYIPEDEQGDKYYLGAELIGQIYQKHLPGQFFTFGGKYYEMRYLTADGKILVRRAADHITGRPYYRQIRTYMVSGTRPSEQIGAIQNISGIKVTKEYADIRVATHGYYKMDCYNDFCNAKKIMFEGEKTSIPDRIYHNKEILKIEFPDANGALTANVRYTIATLMNEVFRTLFAENQPYIVAVTDDAHIAEDTLKPLTYSLKIEGEEQNVNCIYIMEDSQLDLGLTVAVERNLQRILEIVHDYMDWHIEAVDESLNPPPDPESPIRFTAPEEDPVEEKQGIFRRIGNWFKKIGEKIKNLFKRKKKDEPAPEEELTPGISVPENGEDVIPKPEEELTPETSVPENGEEGIPQSEEAPDSDLVSEEQTEKTKKPSFFKKLRNLFKRKKKDEPTQDPEWDVPEQEEVVEQPQEEPIPEAEETVEQVPEGEETTEPEPEIVAGAEKQDNSEMPFNEQIVDVQETETHPSLEFVRAPYHKRHYLLFGYDADPSSIDAVGALEYLTQLGFAHNPLKQAREGKDVAELVETNLIHGKANVRYCDFCGCEIYGVEYETLADGRERCINCGRTAIKTGKEFRKIFEDVKRNLESFFGIRIQAGIRVEMVNSKKLHKCLGKAFIPTPQSDGRILGVAISDKSGYTLMIENGSPKMASMLTIAHELTHIWQYLNWKDKAIVKKYGKKMRLEIYEGMAKWVEIQYAHLINEPVVAKREELITAMRQDEYGRGFIRYLANYPFSLGTVIVHNTPFMFVDQPLDPQFLGDISYVPRMPLNGDADLDVPKRKKGNRPKGGTVKPRKIEGAIERTPDAVKKYAYDCLNTDEKMVYDAVLQAVQTHTAELTSLPASVDDTQIQKIIDYVQVDHPGIFWFRHGATYFFDAATHIVNKVQFTYCMSKEEAQKRQAEIDKMLAPFLESVNERMSDYEVALKVYENIINLVDYDTIGLERQSKTENTPDKPDDLRSVYGVFVNKKAVCAGYAKATQYLMNLLGIECTYVTSDTHAWNLVKLEGDYYHLDTTWGDSSNTEQGHEQGDTIDYDCFCITTEEVLNLKSHKPADSLPLPECTATKCNYHIRSGLCFENYALSDIRERILESVSDGCIDISLKFTNENEYQKCKRDLLQDNKMHEVIQYVNLKTKVKIASSYRYSERDERCILAFYLKKQQ